MTKPVLRAYVSKNIYDAIQKEHTKASEKRKVSFSHFIEDILISYLNDGVQGLINLKEGNNGNNS